MQFIFFAKAESTLRAFDIPQLRRGDVFYFCLILFLSMLFFGFRDQKHFYHINFLYAFPFSERGVVWEETIILLPDNVHYVFLSATIPNARQFAEWICHLHKQVIFLICCTSVPFVLWHNTVWLGDNWTSEYHSSHFIANRW